MGRRVFSREFKLEAVKLMAEQGLALRQADAQRSFYSVEGMQLMPRPNGRCPRS